MQAWFDRLARLPRWAGGTRRADAAQADGSANILDRMGSREFEALLADALQVQGFQVPPSEGFGAGAGVDLVLRRDRQTHLVRCRSWRAARVGIEDVQELHRAMQARGAAGGIVVSSGRFSRAATAFAAGCNVRLIEGAALAAMVRQARDARRAAASGPVPKR